MTPNVVIYRSNIRPADDGVVSPLGGEDSVSTPKVILVKGRLNTQDPNEVPTPMPSFDPQDLIGRTFLVDPDDDGSIAQAKVKQIVQEIEDENETGQFERVKSLISVDKGDHKVEEIVTYNKKLDFIEDNQMDDQVDKLPQAIAITSHHGFLRHDHPDY